jgi:hypothetical protein
MKKSSDDKKRDELALKVLRTPPQPHKPHEPLKKKLPAKKSRKPKCLTEKEAESPFRNSH